MRIVFLLALLLAVPAFAGDDNPDNGENWCDDNPTICACSETLDTTSFALSPNGGWHMDPGPVMTHSKECAFGGSGDDAGMFILGGFSPSVPQGNLNQYFSFEAESGMPAGNGVANVMRWTWPLVPNGRDATAVVRAGSITAATRRLCNRFYFQLSSTFNEWLTANDCNNKVSEFNWSGPCQAQVGPFNGFIMTHNTCWGGDGSNQPNPSQIAISHCVGNWCRAEQCVGGNLEAGTGIHHDWSITQVGVASPVSYSSGDLATTGTHVTNEGQVYPMMLYREVPGGAGSGDTCEGYRRFSHLVEAVWDTDSGQHIGAASEVEGGAGTVVASLVPSTMSGTYPLAVHFDATGTTDSSVDRPFHGLHYAWDFGDPTSGNWAVTGKSKNTDYGPVAGHLYTAAGSYQVTLTVTNPAGETDIETTTITVSAPSFTTAQTWCIRDASDGNFAGCPLDTNADGTCDGADADHCITNADFDDAVNNNTDTIGCNLDGAAGRCLFRAGDTFAQSTTVGGAAGPTLLSSFGSGARPIVNATLSGVSTIGMSIGTDWKVGELNWSANQGRFAVNNSGADRILVWNANLSGYGHFWVIDDSGGSTVSDLLAMVDVNATSGTTGAGGSWTFLTRETRGLYLGVNVDGSALTTENGQFRTVGAYKSVFAHGKIDVGNQPDGLMSWRGPNATWPGALPLQYILVHDNQFLVEDALPLRVCQNNVCVATGSDLNAIDLIWEGNFITYGGDASAALGNVWDVQAGQTTLRNNVIDLTGALFGNNHSIFIEQQASAGTDTTNLHILNNTVYIHSGGPAVALTICGAINDTNTGALCRNNLVYAPGAGSVVFDGSADWTDSNNSNASPRPFAGFYPGAGSSTLDDFQLATGAAAINAGYDYTTDPDVAFVRLDALLGLRPNGGEFDIGADEYDQPTTVIRAPFLLP